MVGGSGEKKTLKLVARFADACNVFGDTQQFKHLMGVLDAHCEDVGRDPAEITRTTMTRICIGADEREAQAKVTAMGLDENWNAGSPEQVAERVRKQVDAGVEGLTVVMPDAHDLDAVRLLGETLAPVLSR